MKLRIARKIIMNVTDDATGNPTGRNNESQLQRAYYRWNKCKSAKADKKLFLNLAKEHYRQRALDNMFNKIMSPRPAYGLIAAMAV